MHAILDIKCRKYSNMKELMLQIPVTTCSVEKLDPVLRELVEKAKSMTQNAYCPYSHFHVGAAALLADGQVIAGSNQENAAYPSGICAERTAMFYASASNPGKNMAAIAIAAGQNGQMCKNPVSPCGACRQVMAQYQTKSGRPMAILLIGAEKIWKFEKVQDLLPLIFDSI